MDDERQPSGTSPISSAARVVFKMRVSSHAHAHLYLHLRPHQPPAPPALPALSTSATNLPARQLVSTSTQRDACERKPSGDGRDPASRSRHRRRRRRRCWPTRLLWITTSVRLRRRRQRRFLIGQRRRWQYVIGWQPPRQLHTSSQRQRRQRQRRRRRRDFTQSPRSKHSTRAVIHVRE